MPKYSVSFLDYSTKKYNNSLVHAKNKSEAINFVKKIRINSKFFRCNRINEKKIKK